MPGLGRTISDTYTGEKEKCEARGVGVSCQNFWTKLRPVISVIE